MLISGKILSIEFSPYEAFIRFLDSNVDDISAITVKSNSSDPLRGLCVNEPFELDCVLWLGHIKNISESINTTYMRQPNGLNGAIGCGRVTDVLHSDIFIIEINGVPIRLETEIDYNISKGNFVEFTAELHSEI
ncbi:hypothetical protein TUM4261_38440 [Shewanella sp. c952]|uniref:hypothetical protein n=1 Tax=Shewanella sp. c952 TaxID=2815913 RepID=UPI001BBA1245|nr:hypothetical protein [Shewanella sp. c952]GIU18076.1 hypothetical protein TUM4261_38440 [Shewanella sp. c952]